ncbi:MAG: hypothetical protein U0936_15600 [Planctomycetaceae bacterium]
MTTLRFVGDVPLWAGLLATVVVRAVALFSRESFDLPHRLRWLPLLRSLAFLLGYWCLPGRCHHRMILGELGRVKIYVDSRSMTMQDRLYRPEESCWLPNSWDGSVPGESIPSC